MKYRKNNGFTLIETIIYMSLTSIIITSSMLLAYQIIDSSERMSRKIITSGERNFLEKKIEWAISSAQIINPPPNKKSQTLKLQRGALILEFDSENENARIKRNSNDPTVLNSDNVKISNLEFEYINETGKPKSIKTTLNLNDETFEIINYLK